MIAQRKEQSQLQIDYSLSTLSLRSCVFFLSEKVFHSFSVGELQINREISESVQRRIPWFTEKRQDGLVSLIGLLKGKRVGFPNMFPIEISPWGQVGRELFVITCLFVTGTFRIME